MFQKAIEYSTQMTNILLRISNLEIKNKQIIEKNDQFVQNLQGALEKEQKLKSELKVKKHENNEALEKLQIVRQNINNMEKYNKDLKKIKVERDFLQATLM
jgi:hypothetical protein